MDIGGIISLVIAVVSLAVSISSFVLTYIVDKRKRTIEAYLALQEDLYVLYAYPKGEIETFITEADTEEYKILSSCLGQIEIFATGVQKKVYNFKLVYELAHGYLDMALRDKIEYLLDMKREYAKPRFYQATEWLLNEMDKKTKRA